MLTFTAVLAPPAYNEGHLARLYEQASAHIRQPFCWQPVLDSPWRGWWSKLSLFEPGRFVDGPILYLDLDVNIVGPLDDLVDVEGSFVIARDFLTLGFNSSVMCWGAGAGQPIWDEWIKGPEHHMQRHRGDQTFIAECMPGAATFPRTMVQSYKADVLPGRRHPDCRVICYHGQPKPWDLEAA